MDYVKQYPVAMKAIAEWIEKGLLKRKFHIVNGLDAAPSALPLLYSGGNTGKLCVTSLSPGPRSLLTSPHQGCQGFRARSRTQALMLFGCSLTVISLLIYAVIV